ncbi:hypothetical protein Tco_1434176, partial [Tanacetum coccineum]
PTIDHDLDYFNDFENEFLAIVYNDGLTSKSDLWIKTPVSTDKTDECDPIDETSLSEYEEEIISRFNDLFNDTHSVDLKSEIDNDNEREDEFLETCRDETRDDFEIRYLVTNLSLAIYYCMTGMLFFLIMNLCVPFEIPFDPKRYYKDGSRIKFCRGQDMAPLPTADQRYLWLRLRGFDSRDEAGSGREIEDGIYWGEGAEFLSTCRMSDTMMDLDAAGTLCFQLGGFRRRMSWRQFILALGLQTEQEMAEGRFGDYWAESDRLIPDKGDLRDYWLQISSDRDFLGPVPSY